MVPCPEMVAVDKVCKTHIKIMIRDSHVLCQMNTMDKHAIKLQ